MKEFIIPFFGLKLGTHEFNFEIGPTFFEAFENSLVENAQVEVHLELEKLSNMIVLRFEANGFMDDFCDRCGDPLRVSLSASDEIFVKFGDEDYEQTDEILVVSHSTHEIDTAQLIYELVALNLPGKKLHATIEQCNQEVLEKLRIEESKKDDKDTDPRWSILNKLK